MAQARVVRCDAVDCAYNQEASCHALAITVGDRPHPHCGTYLKAKVRGGDDEAAGCVCMCKMDRCRFNQGLRCHAPDIRVGLLAGGAVCTTSAAKEVAQGVPLKPLVERSTGKGRKS
jgi:hypothetical protein